MAACFGRVRHWLGVLGAAMLLINFYTSWEMSRASTQQQRTRRRNGGSVVGKHVGSPVSPVTRSWKETEKAKVRGDKERASKGDPLVQSISAVASDKPELAPRPMAQGAAQDASAQKHAPETDVALGRQQPWSSGHEEESLARLLPDRTRKTAGIGVIMCINGINSKTRPSIHVHLWQQQG